jgi:hypothetical protein
MWAGLFVVPLAAALVGAAAARAPEPEFLEQCVSAMMKDGRPKETAFAACDCIAKRTVDKPELRDEFLVQISAPRQALQKSSPALRQVRAACVPMPIWAQGEAG